MKYKVWIFLLALSLLISQSAAGESEELSQIRARAVRGETAAQVLLGNYCYFGDKMPANQTEAVKWYRLAAAQNDPEAQCMLGICYYFGHGVVQNMSMAIRWWKLSATQGFSDAQFALQRLGLSW